MPLIGRGRKCLRLLDGLIIAVIWLYWGPLLRHEQDRINQTLFPTARPPYRLATGRVAFLLRSFNRLETDFFLVTGVTHV